MRFALCRVRETWRAAGMYYYNKDPRFNRAPAIRSDPCIRVRASLALRAHQNPFYNPLIPPGYWSPPRVSANVGDLRRVSYTITAPRHTQSLFSHAFLV